MKLVAIAVSAATSTVLLAATLTAPACGPAAEPDPCEGVKAFADITAFANSCIACHNSTLTDLDARAQAPLGTDYDSYAAASTNVAGTLAQVRADLMPPEDGAPITDAERADLIQWLECGTPE